MRLAGIGKFGRLAGIGRFGRLAGIGRCVRLAGIGRFTNEVKVLQGGLCGEQILLGRRLSARLDL